MPDMPSKDFKVGEEVSFTLNNTTYAGTVMAVFVNKIRVKLFNSDRKFLVRPDALVRMFPNESKV